MKKVLMILLCILLCGCSNEKENSIEKIMRENEYVIIDVRTKDEYEESHVVDSINIPYDKIDNEINIDKDTIIFVYCKSGRRSSIAHDTLENLGYTVYDLGAYEKLDLEKVAK